MKVAKNTWMFGDDFLTFHGFWRQSENPGVVFIYIENGDIKKQRLHFAHVNAVIGYEWMDRNSGLTDNEKERLLINRNALNVDNELNENKYKKI